MTAADSLLLLNQALGTGDWARAEQIARTVLQGKPQDAAMATGLGLACYRQSNFAAAADAFRLALQQRPQDAGLWSNLASALLDLHQVGAAIDAAKQALALQPDSIEALNTLGMALDRSGQAGEAAAIYRQALDIVPSPVIWNNLGNVLKSMAHMDQAIAAYREAIRLDPLFFRAWSNMLLVMHYSASLSAETIASEHSRFGAALARHVERSNPNPLPPDNSALNVGFISADFYNHPVGRLFLPVLQAHRQAAGSRSRWLLYAQNRVSDRTTRQLRDAADDWCDIAGLNDDALEQRIRADNIHVLVDLSGHTAGNRLPFFARHVAPVQTAWLGYASSTGMDTMDYILADSHTLPPQDQALYSERVWRLPGSYIACTQPASSVPTGAPPCLQNGYVTFAAFNNTAKFTPDVIRTWAHILQRLPDARILFKNRGFAAVDLVRSFIERFRQHGIGPQRLQFEGEAYGADYFAAYNRVDIALDPFPFPGLMTSLDTLWMGVPIISMSGRHGMLSRHSDLLAHSVGASEWCCSSEAEYIQRAVELAQNPGQLIQWRDCLRPLLLHSPLFAPQQLAVELDSAFAGMIAEKKTPTHG